MDIPEHRSCIFLVFQRRIQASLNRAKEAWNFHQMCTEHNKTPIALFSISRQTAISRGYWTGDPGDPVEDAIDPFYGFDGAAPMPPAQEQLDDPPVLNEDPELAGLGEAQTEELENCRQRLEELQFDCDREDGNWGINVYLSALHALRG